MTTLRLMAALLLTTLAASADVLVFSDLTNTASVQQLPDSPGGQLKDAVTFYPISCNGCGPVLCPMPVLCSILVYASDGLTPAEGGGDLAFGDQKTRLVKDVIPYNAKSSSQFGPSYFVGLGTNQFFVCPPSICPVILPETPGVLESVLTIPWVDSKGNIVRSDTIDFVPADVPEPAHLVFLLALGAVVIRRARGR